MKKIVNKIVALDYIERDWEISSDIARLEVDLEYTLRAIDGKSKNLDDIFTSQANKLRHQIKKLKETN